VPALPLLAGEAPPVALPPSLAELPVLGEALVPVVVDAAAGGFAPTVTRAPSPPGAVTVTVTLYDATCAYVPHVSVNANVPAFEAETV